MLPPNQRLDSLDPAGIEGDLRLVVEHELLLGDGCPELAQESEALTRVDVELVVIDDNVLVGVLGHIHGHVRALQKHVGAVPILRGDGDAATGGHIHRHSFDVKGLLQEADDPFGNLKGCSAAFDPWEQDAELIAAQPGECVTVPKALVDPWAHFPQHPIPVLVAERVVDLLEPVQVEEQDGGAATVPGRLTQSLVRAVEEAGRGWGGR